MKSYIFLPSRLLLLSFAIAAAFSAFIYFEYFDATYKMINTFLGLAALYGLLFAPRQSLPMSGFFIGLLWFYWIGYSFKYYGMPWAEPLIAFGFGLVYAIYFGLLAFTNHPIIRSIILFGLTYIWPMDFNWMQPEAIFTDSYLGVSKLDFALILISLSLTLLFHRWKKLIPLLMLSGAFHLSYPVPKAPELKIKLVSTDLSQDFKWQSDSLPMIVKNNLAMIDDALREGYDLIVLPESAFSLYMNHYPDLIEALKKRSENITILTGTLYEEKGKFYNVSYLFQDQQFSIAKKMILVPFGEYIPLPSFMKEWVNREIFGGGSDFQTAQMPTDFAIKGITFRNAICYEATRPEFYTPELRYLIAISNNGWFTPSIEPTLQKILIRYNARRNGTLVFHAANGSESMIIH